MDFDEKVSAFLSCRKNANNIVDLINYLQMNNLNKKECIVALENLFIQIFVRGDLKVDQDLKVLNPKGSVAEEKYVEWLLSLYEKTFNIILSLTKGSDLPLSIQSYSSTFNLIAAEVKNPLKVDDQFPLEKLKKIIRTLLSNHSTSCLEDFSDYFQYQDTLFYAWKCLKDVLSEQDDISDQFLSSTLDLLEKITLPKSKKEQTTPALFFYDGVEQERFVYSEDTIRKWMQRVWMRLINCRLSETNHRKLLIVLLESYLSSLKKPTLLTDFFFSSLAVPGATGLLALQGMSTLVTKHNLECPNIFGLLYNMFVPDLFYTRYKARLFYQADMFLQSTYISEQLVAAFAKRLSRLSLVAQACDLVLILQFVGNLLIRHPGLMVLVHHPSGDPVESDPFDMAEKDPVKSRAIESSLWELVLLKNHVQPKVAAAAKFLDGSFPSMEYNFHEHLDSTYEQMFFTEMKKNPKAEPSLTFTRPSYGIAKLKDDKVYKMWALT